MLLRQESECASAVIMGMMIGQVFGGTLGDMLGVQRAIFLVMMIQIISCLSSSLSSLHASPTMNDFAVTLSTSSSSQDMNSGGRMHRLLRAAAAILSSIPAMSVLLKQLTFWRFWLGVGCGGVYPLAAVLSSRQQQQQQIDEVGGGYKDDTYDEESTDLPSELDEEDGDLIVEDYKEDVALIDLQTSKVEKSRSTSQLNPSDVIKTMISPRRRSQMLPIKRRTKSTLIQETVGDHHDDIKVSDTAEKAAKDDSKKNQLSKLQSLALTFSTQGVAFLTVPSLTYVLLLVSFPSPDMRQTMTDQSVYKLDVVWRIISAIGSLPGLTLMMYLYFYSSRDEIKSKGGGGHGDSWIRILQYYCFSFWKKPRNREVVDREPIFVEHNRSSSNGSLADGMEPLVSEVPEEDATIRSTTNYQRRLPSSATCEKQKKGLWESILSEEDLTRKMLGTAGTWFLFDVIFYGNTLFQQLILEVAFNQDTAKDTTSHGRRLVHDSGNQDIQPTIASLMKTTRDSSILSLLALPGYFFTVFLLGKITCRCIHQTPRFIQIQGFIWMTVLYGTLGVFWDTLTNHQSLLILLYGGTFFFSNYGPNSITFMLPSLTFSEDCRSTLNGICAACGKLGALVGASLFQPLAEKLGPPTVMLLCAGLSIVACVVSILCI